MPDETGGPSIRAMEVLRLLKRHHNVLISGPPGTGKSRLLNEVHRWFKASAQPGHDPGAPIPLPDGLVVTPEEAADWLPSPTRTNRQVFPTAFHPGSKYRDFLRGLIPKVGAGQTFLVSSGTLYSAAVVGLTDDGAALVIVDEINRGPAVQVFGDSLVALERDKRLGPAGEELMTTQYLRIMQDNGTFASFALPHHLYLLAAMNQADTSVEPLDVAFLRRFEPYHLEPDSLVVRDRCNLPDGDLATPDDPTTAAHVYAASLLAWEQVNRRIAIGRGPEYQIGHGVFFETDDTPPTGDVAAAIDHIAAPWRRIRAHVDEVFFGHTRGVAAALNVGAPGHPLYLIDTYFAREPVAALSGEIQDLYRFLRAVAAADAE